MLLNDLPPDVLTEIANHLVRMIETIKLRLTLRSNSPAGVE